MDAMRSSVLDLCAVAVAVKRMYIILLQGKRSAVCISPTPIGERETERANEYRVVVQGR